MLKQNQRTAAWSQIEKVCRGFMSDLLEVGSPPLHLTALGSGRAQCFRREVATGQLQGGGRGLTVHKAPLCYLCRRPARTREHVPPKSFFPRGGNLQLMTVPSCEEHNNAKSDDDQYLLAHITLHAASGDNLAKKVFIRFVRAPARKKAAVLRVPRKSCCSRRRWHGCLPSEHFTLR